MSIDEILDSIDSFSPTREQKDAIKSRNYALASDLGVSMDQYLACISNNYRAKLARLRS